MTALHDLTGHRFARLTVVHRAENLGKHTAWCCRCDCGNTKTIRAHHLKEGTISSCGCYQQESRGATQTTHRKTRTPEYQVWVQMRQRCINRNHHAFANYGGRGITVCDQWQGAEGFATFSRTWASDPKAIRLTASTTTGPMRPTTVDGLTAKPKRKTHARPDSLQPTALRAHSQNGLNLPG